MNNLQRFLDAQANDYHIALSEIKHGRKHSHWIWYIFPQLKGLGLSHNAEFYGISDLNEAAAYLQHPVLGVRLSEISRALLDLRQNDPELIMEYPDDMKLRSSMTLFSRIPGADIVFQTVLDQYFKGEEDKQTIELLERIQ